MIYLFVLAILVSILVLMELCIKTIYAVRWDETDGVVSILVLMELCIKTDDAEFIESYPGGFQSLF